MGRLKSQDRHVGGSVWRANGGTHTAYAVASRHAPFGYARSGWVLHRVLKVKVWFHPSWFNPTDYLWRKPVTLHVQWACRNTCQRPVLVHTREQSGLELCERCFPDEAKAPA